jgi:large subunit ribosomal protein L30
MSDKEKKKEQGTVKKAAGPQIAIIRIRGDIRVNRDIKAALSMAGLGKKNTCVLKPDTPHTRGTLKKVKDYVTWGILSGEIHKLLTEKRKGKKENSFRLHPPRKGFGRKGIKASFVNGGALGDRKEKINDLITRMV